MLIAPYVVAILASTLTVGSHLYVGPSLSDQHKTSGKLTEEQIRTKGIKVIEELKSKVVMKSNVVPSKTTPSPPNDALEVTPLHNDAVLGGVQYPGSNPQALLPPDPTLSVATPLTSYRIGDPITLIVTLYGGGPLSNSPYWTDWEVCTFAPAVISVVYVTKDGKRMVPKAVLNDFPDDPTNLALRSLESLSATSGITVDIPLPVGRSKSGAARMMFGGINGAYSLVRRDPSTNRQTVIQVPAYQAEVYEIEQAGTYAIKLRYRYSGPLINGMYLFAGTVESNEVVFKVR